MNTLRPVKRNFASATAARKASAIETATVMPTMITLFTTELQKYGRSIASRKCWSVGCTGNQLGVSLLMLVGRLERASRTSSRPGRSSPRRRASAEEVPAVRASPCAAALPAPRFTPRLPP